VVTKQSSSCHWHPILGWFSQKEDPALQESLPLVRKQLSRLWDVSVTQAMFNGLSLDYQSSMRSTTSNIQKDQQEKNEAPLSLSRLRKVIDKAASAITNSDSIVITGHPDALTHLATQEIKLVSAVCSMYTAALTTLTQIRLEILTGLCYNNTLIRGLWTFISSLDERCGLITFLELLHHLKLYPSSNHGSDMTILTLFCECATHLIT